jgi:hypothetical protein
MSDPVTSPDLAAPLAVQVTRLRMVVAALTAGVLVFAGVAVYLRQTSAAPVAPDAAQLLTWLAVAAAPLALLASRLVPAAVVRSARRQISQGTFPATPPAATPAELGESGKFASVHFAGTVLAAAILEGAAFFNITVYLLGGGLIVLAVGVALALTMLLLLPSAADLAEWIREQQRLLREEQHLEQLTRSGR